MEPELLSLSYKSRLQVKWAGVLRPYRTFFQKQHFNPNYELIAVSGEPLHLIVEEEKKILRSGDVLILYPWQRHRGWNPESATGEFYWVQFTADPPFSALSSQDVTASRQKPGIRLMRTMAEEEEGVLPLARSLHFPSKFKLLSQIELLVNEMTQMKDNYLYKSNLLLGGILEMLSEETLKHLERDTPEVSPSFLLFRRAVSFLDNFFMEDIGKELLENQFERSYEYLGQVFKKYSGITLLDYVQQLRVQRACYLLMNTEKTVKAVGEEVGFEDAFHFSKVFKRSTGFSPSLYRLKPWE